MQVSKEEILHIADLAELTIEENEVENYIVNLQDILNFANIVNNAPVEGLEITIGANEAKNVFRKDEVKVFDNIEGLLQNAPEQDRQMFKIPKVLNWVWKIIAIWRCWKSVETRLHTPRMRPCLSNNFRLAK